MGWAGVPVYLTIAVLPVILTTIGLADEIHVFWHYQRILEKGASNPEAVAETMDHLTRPVVLTSLTTSIGFLSFLASPIEPVRAFGLFAAAGILFCMIWTLTFIPAALALLPAGWMRRPRRAPGAGWVARATAPLLRHRALTLSAIVVVTAVGLLGARRLQVQDSWIGGFARNSPFRQATDLVNEKLHGTHLLLAHLEFDAPEEETPQDAPLLRAAVVRAIGDLEATLRSLPEVGGVLGPYDHLTTVHFLSSARRAGSRTLPRDAARMERLLTYFDKARGAHRRREILHDDRRRAVVTVFLENANYRDTARVMAAAREHTEAHLAPLGARLDFAGDVAVSQAMIPAIVRTQVTSLLLAIGSAFVAVALLLRSVRAGLCAILPAAVASLWVFGAMGWLGIPLGVATSMFCAITLGVGVDYAIHFLESARRAREAGHPDPARGAVAEVGPAIAIDTAAIALGFGLLAASSVPANARLGLLVALALTAGSILTLGGLGASAPGHSAGRGPGGLRRVPPLDPGSLSWSPSILPLRLRTDRDRLRQAGSPWGRPWHRHARQAGVPVAALDQTADARHDQVELARRRRRHRGGGEPPGVALERRVGGEAPEGPAIDLPVVVRPAARSPAQLDIGSNASHLEVDDLRRERRLACIALAVAVRVGLVVVGDARTVVRAPAGSGEVGELVPVGIALDERDQERTEIAGIPLPIAVGILLKRVRGVATVVAVVRHSVQV